MKTKILKISIVGKTNAGKSTLINSLVGELVSITNKKINTTEDLITGVQNINKNQLIFFDTPGLHFIKEIKKNKNKLKINLWEGLNLSDIILYIIDSKTYKFEDLKFYINKISELKKKISIVFNKSDLINKNKILPEIVKIDKLKKIDSFFLISAKKKIGLKNIQKYLLKNSYESKWIYKENEISNKDEIFLTNECTRNALLTAIHKEIPYNIKINNKTFKFLKNGDLKIKQEIEIYNSRYKKIILGKKGTKIKDIREKSQNEIAKILKVRVHLYINIIQINAKKI